MATSKQIQQEIIDWVNTEYPSSTPKTTFESAWPDFLDSLWSYGDTKKEAELPSGTATEFKKFGGEGKGEEYWAIIQVGDELFEVSGYYSSWDGVSWDDAEICKVEPVEVTVIEYQKVKE